MFLLSDVERRKSHEEKKDLSEFLKSVNWYYKPKVVENKDDEYNQYLKLKNEPYRNLEYELLIIFYLYLAHQSLYKAIQV